LTKADLQHPDVGFTLLEVLIAFTLVAFVLAAVMQLYSGGLRSTGISEQRVAAAMLAQSKLAEMAAKQPLVPRVESGLSGTGYRWRAEVRKYWEMAAVEQPETNPVVLYQLTVDVEWGPVARPRNFELTTLRIGWPEEAVTEGDRQ
jgi:general secretion pathway protein I